MLHGTGDFNIYIHIYIYRPDFCYLEHTVAGCRQIQAAAERFGVKGLEDIQAA